LFEYAVEAVQKYGAFKGGWLGLNESAVATRGILAGTIPYPDSRIFCRLFMDTRRLILVLIFTFSSFMLWENWQKYNQPKPP
jgi:hypothetical protein